MLYPDQKKYYRKNKEKILAQQRLRLKNMSSKERKKLNEKSKLKAERYRRKKGINPRQFGVRNTPKIKECPICYEAMKLINNKLICVDCK